MRLSQITLLLAAAGVGNCSPAKRQGPNEPLVVLSPGSITAPANGTRVEAGHSFTLGIADPVPEWSHCHPGYTPVDLYLVADKPTVSSLNSTQQFSSYLHYYGEYLVNNLPGKYGRYRCSSKPLTCLYVVRKFASYGHPSSVYVDCAKASIVLQRQRNLSCGCRNHLRLSCKCHVNSAALTLTGDWILA